MGNSIQKLNLEDGMWQQFKKCNELQSLNVNIAKDKSNKYFIKSRSFTASKAHITIKVESNYSQTVFPKVSYKYPTPKYKKITISYETFSHH